jgi:hypothetical protein
MLLIALVGALVLLALSILCLTAYMTGAEWFEFSATIPKLFTFSFKIISRKGRAGRRVIEQARAPRHRVPPGARP